VNFQLRRSWIRCSKSDHQSAHKKRCHADAKGPLTSEFRLILSQTEIETVGLEAPGRLRLIDEFVRGRGQFDIDEAAAAAAVRSQTADIDSLRKEISDLQQQIVGISEIDEQLLILRPQEEALSKLSSEAAEKKKRLDALVGRTTELSVSASYVERFQKAFKQWCSSSERVLQTTPLPERWPNSPVQPDPLAEVRSKLTQLRSVLQEAQRLANEIGAKSETAVELYVTERVALDDHTRTLRKEVDDILKGAGAIARQAQVLREQKARLIALKGVLTDNEQRLKVLILERDASLDRLEEIRTARFNSRKVVITALNSALAPRIRTAIERAGQQEQYVCAVTAALRGSGLRYNDLAAMIASQISPRELIDAVESSDVDLLVEVLRISKGCGYFGTTANHL
jgi:DNA repair exonuclease SbcCD ATPase subunit